VNGRSVGRRSAGRRITDRVHDSKATGDAEADASISAALRPRPASSWRARVRHAAALVSVHVSATDPSRTPSGRPRPALRALLPVGRQRDTSLKPMTTPVTVSHDTNSRRQNIPAAAGHRRRARRSPGRSPGTTDFASRPGFPHDLGWGPLQNGRERVRRAPVPPHPSGVGVRSVGRPAHQTLVNASYSRRVRIAWGIRRSATTRANAARPRRRFRRRRPGGRGE
jgi:hypothetical protein